MAGWHHQLNWYEFMQTPGDSEGQGTLVCCSPWGHKESDTTEQQLSAWISPWRETFSLQHWTVGSCPTLWKEKQSLIPKVVHYTNTLEKMVWNKGSQFMSSQDVQKCKILMCLPRPAIQ